MPLMSEWEFLIEGIVLVVALGLVVVVRGRARRRFEAQPVNLLESELSSGVITFAPGTKFKNS